MYEIVTDPLRKLIRARTTSFFDVDGARRYMRELGDAVSALGEAGQVSMLVDSSGSPIQSRDVMAVLDIEALNVAHVGRIAIVTGTAASRMQARRSLMGNSRCFETVAEAEAWLAEPMETRSAA